MPPVDVRLPQFGMGMQEGTVITWHKKEGDTVEAGDVVAEVEAAKTTEDLVAPAGGVLQRILVPEGETVPVHELLAVIAPAGAEAPEEAAAPGEPGEPAPAAGAAPAPGAPAATGPPRQVTPRARRLARELGVDLDTVVGSGPGGRVTEDDVAAAASRGRPAAPTAPTSTQVTSIPGTPMPLTRMRATIADRMLTSLQSSAQLTLVTTADVTDLVAYRDSLGDDRPTYTDLIVKAAALALPEHPRLNAALLGDEIRLFSAIHIGIATALDDGLVVPVVRNADRKSVREIARESADLVRRVRAGDFTVDDVSGSTFTVTSLGGQGIDAFTPIINPPEVAILGVGRVIDHPAREGDGLVWRKAIALSLTIDHRGVDGAPGAAFLQTVSELLRTPERLDR